MIDVSFDARSLCRFLPSFAASVFDPASGFRVVDHELIGRCDVFVYSHYAGAPLRVAQAYVFVDGESSTAYSGAPGVDEDEHC